MRDSLLTFAGFVASNSRWLAGGILLSFFSSFGQTFFLARFAGAIREDFGLTHRGFGMICMLATLGSAATVSVIGRILDEVRVVIVAVSLILPRAGSALLLASARSVAVLLLAV